MLALALAACLAVAAGPSLPRDEAMPGHRGFLVEELPLTGFTNLEGLDEDEGFAQFLGTAVLLYEVEPTEPGSPAREEMLARVKRYDTLHDTHGGFGLVVLAVVAAGQRDYRVTARDLGLRTPYCCYDDFDRGRTRREAYEVLGRSFPLGVLIDPFGVLTVTHGVSSHEVKPRIAGAFHAPLWTWPEEAGKVASRVLARDVKRAFDEAERLAGELPVLMDDLRDLCEQQILEVETDWSDGDHLTAWARIGRLRDELRNSPYGDVARDLYEDVSGDSNGSQVRREQRELRELVDDAEPEPDEAARAVEELQEFIDEHPVDEPGGRALRAEARAWLGFYREIARRGE